MTEQALNPDDVDFSAERQRELAAGVLKQAAQDLRRFHGATNPQKRAVYLDAYGWLMVDDFAWPFSFLNVCRILEVAPEMVRQELVDDISLGRLAYWTRRCGRAARQLRVHFHSLSLRNATSIPLMRSGPLIHENIS